MRQLWFCGFLLVFSGLLASCRDDDRVELPENDPETSLTFATPEAIESGRVVPHSYLVAFRNLLLADQDFLAGYQRTARAHLQALNEDWARPSLVQDLRYLSRLNFNQLSQSFRSVRTISPAPWLKQEPTRDPAWASLVEVRFRNEAEAHAVLTRWYEDKKIWYAEPNHTQDLSGELEDRLSAAFGGSNAGVAPWLDQIDFVPAIQEVGKTQVSTSPLIAVMDSGVDVEHPSLRDAVYVNERGENKLQCRNDRFGCNTTVSKKDLLGDGAVFPTGTRGFSQACPLSLGDAAGQCEHGTHVAGLIVARNSSRVSGICPYCKILVVKVVENRDGRLAISDAAIIAGLSYISGFQEGGQPLVRVINASYGKFESTRSVELFIRALKNFGRGILMVAAAGNEDTTKKQYPAAFEDVLAVSNVLADEGAAKKSESSNFGSWVDIAAPGDWFGCVTDTFASNGLLSTVPGGEFGCKVGTSMATPIVSGVAGLVLAKEPQLSAYDLEQRLRSTAVTAELYKERLNSAYRPTLEGQSVPLLGSGLVNALRAVRPDLDLDPTPSQSVDLPERVKPGCGVIGGQNHGYGWILSAIILLWPLLWVQGRSFLSKTRSER